MRLVDYTDSSDESGADCQPSPVVTRSLPSILAHGHSSKPKGPADISSLTPAARASTLHNDDDDDDDDDDAQAIASQDQRPAPTTITSATATRGAARPPPLPPGFRNLYAGTVRSSPYDDASLHHGRVRITPHAAGHWPTHVYIEWQPVTHVLACLSDLIERETAKVLYKSRAPDDDNHHGSGIETGTATKDVQQVQSLLRNELGVLMPLHVSLSRPLMLRTDQKAEYLARLQRVLRASGVRAFHAALQTVCWHPNESRTRWFLVLGFGRPKGDEWQKLLDASNSVAREFGQPVLYEDDADGGGGVEKLHVSVAWSLQEPGEVTPRNLDPSTSACGSVLVDEVKIRIGQDVTSVPLLTRRV